MMKRFFLRLSQIAVVLTLLGWLTLLIVFHNPDLLFIPSAISFLGLFFFQEPRGDLAFLTRVFFCLLSVSGTYHLVSLAITIAPTLDPPFSP
jgi:hypothetical protein